MVKPDSEVVRLPPHRVAIRRIIALTSFSTSSPPPSQISEFNEIVNMSASELEEWLKSESSESAGWGGESGETVGHESGRNIVDILKRNPKKQEDKYTEDDIAHMRKVVSYCKRHLAQEAKMKETKSKEELEQTKSVRSLRSEFMMIFGVTRMTFSLTSTITFPQLDWGHDPLR